MIEAGFADLAGRWHPILDVFGECGRVSRFSVNSDREGTAEATTVRRHAARVVASCREG